MNQKVRIGIGIVVGVMILYGWMFFVDWYRCTNQKVPIFAIQKKEKDEKSILYQGIGYQVEVTKNGGWIVQTEMKIFGKTIAGAISEVGLEQEEGLNERKQELGRIVKVGGTLYYDTGKESLVEARCGTMDGWIQSHTDSYKIPVKDKEANFEGNYGYQYVDKDTLELYIDQKWRVFKAKKVQAVLTLEDEIQEDTIWCGTFQLIWNDLKNELAKQDIQFSQTLAVVDHLNKETFTTNDLSEESYYKKIGIPSIQLKEEIKRDIMEKFQENSDILEDFNWLGKETEDYFLYAMLKKEFQFEQELEEFEKGDFGNNKNIHYFGIRQENKNDKMRQQVSVLYYHSKEDFAIQLKTKQKDEVILCKNPVGNTFQEIYQQIQKEANHYEGIRKLQEGEILKIPSLTLKEKAEFTELENQTFYFSNGKAYEIEKAMQSILFKLDQTGGKVKSEAGMMVTKESLVIQDELREFLLDHTFAIFLKEEDKNIPYFAGKITDITKFQENL